MHQRESLEANRIVNMINTLAGLISDGELEARVEHLEMALRDANTAHVAERLE